MKTNKDFPNGFEMWMETFYEVVQNIEHMTRTDWDNEELYPEEEGVTWIKSPYTDYRAQVGSLGMYQLAERMTDKFEKLHQGREWDGEFIEEVARFCEKFNPENYE